MPGIAAVDALEVPRARDDFRVVSDFLIPRIGALGRMIASQPHPPGRGRGDAGLGVGTLGAADRILA